MTRPLSKPPDRWPVIAVLVAVAVYGATLGHGFVYDDGIDVVNNTYVHSLGHLDEIFTHTVWAGSGVQNPLYRPLGTATYALNHAVSGLRPWSYHLVNVALHAAISFLVWRLARSWGLGPSAAGVAAVLFAAHPIHVEAVANVAGRKELLTAVFLLGMVLAHRHARERGGAALVLSPAAFALAMLSKETGVAGVALVVLQDLLAPRCKSDAGRSRLVGLYVAHALVLLGFLGVYVQVVGGIGYSTISFADNPMGQAPVGVRLMTAVSVVGRGLGLLALPLTLSPDYSYNVVPLVESAADSSFLLAAFAVAACLGVAVWAAVRRLQPLGLLVAGWYAATLLPAANLLFPVGTVFGERLLYLPSVAFCVLVGYLAGELLAPRLRHAVGTPAGGVTLLLVAVALLAGRTWSYAAVWSDELSLFRAGVATVPNSFKMNHKLGDALADAGDPEAAIASYRRALEILPRKPATWQQMGRAYEATGQLAAAEEAYRELLEIVPDNANALYSLGRVLRNRGQIPEAVRLWQRVLESHPDHPQSLEDLGTWYFLSNDLTRARQMWERAAAVKPDGKTIYYNLGLLYQRLGDAGRARAAWEEFLLRAGDDFAAQRAQVERALAEPRR